MHYIAYDPVLFINGKRSAAKSHAEDKKYICRFDPCNEISKLLYEIFEKSKKQDLTPPWSGSLLGDGCIQGEDKV
jgi:hypothetical protein